jgi:hypothetical protein
VLHQTGIPLGATRFHLAWDRTIKVVAAQREGGGFSGGYNMKGRLTVAVVVGLVIGLTILLAGRQQEAQGQKREIVRQWEYKVFAFGIDPDQRKAADSQTERMNQLAAEGWEYVGPLSTSSQAFGVQRNQTHYTTYVAFKRPKK